MNFLDHTYFAYPRGVTKKICNAWSKNVGVDFIEQIKNWSKDSNSMGISSAMLGSEGKK